MNDTKTDLVVEIRRTFDAPRTRVFDAWTKPEIIKQWFGPGSYTIPEATVDLREGGAYRIVMFDPEDGERNIAVGTFTTIRRPEHLEYTWQWEDAGPESPSQGKVTRVTIDFVDRGAQTEMLFRHEGFPNDESRNGHERGWTSIVEKLSAHLAKAA